MRCSWSRLTPTDMVLKAFKYLFLIIIFMSTGAIISKHLKLSDFFQILGSVLSGIIPIVIFYFQRYYDKREQLINARPQLNIYEQEFDPGENTVYLNAYLYKKSVVGNYSKVLSLLNDHFILDISKLINNFNIEEKLMSIPMAGNLNIDKLNYGKCLVIANYSNNDIFNVVLKFNDESNSQIRFSKLEAGQEIKIVPITNTTLEKQNEFIDKIKSLKSKLKDNINNEDIDVELNSEIKKLLLNLGKNVDVNYPNEVIFQNAFLPEVEKDKTLNFTGKIYDLIYQFVFQNLFISKSEIYCTTKLGEKLKYTFISNHQSNIEAVSIYNKEFNQNNVKVKKIINRIS